MSASTHTAPPTAKQFVPVAAACLLALVLALGLVSIGVDKVRGAPSTSAAKPATPTEAYTARATAAGTVAAAESSR